MWLGGRGWDVGKVGERSWGWDGEGDTGGSGDGCSVRPGAAAAPSSARGCDPWGRSGGGSVGGGSHRGVPVALPGAALTVGRWDGGGGRSHNPHRGEFGAPSQPHGGSETPAGTPRRTSPPSPPPPFLAPFPRVAAGKERAKGARNVLLQCGGSRGGPTATGRGWGGGVGVGKAGRCGTGGRNCASCVGERSVRPRGGAALWAAPRGDTEGGHKGGGHKRWPHRGPPPQRPPIPPPPPFLPSEGDNDCSDGVGVAAIPAPHCTPPQSPLPRGPNGSLRGGGG